MLGGRPPAQAVADHLRKSTPSAWRSKRENKSRGVTYDGENSAALADVSLAGKLHLGRVALLLPSSAPAKALQ